MRHDREEIRELVIESYRVLAPKKLTALLWQGAEPLGSPTIRQRGAVVPLANLSAGSRGRAERPERQGAGPAGGIRERSTGLGAPPVESWSDVGRSWLLWGRW